MLLGATRGKTTGAQLPRARMSPRLGFALNHCSAGNFVQDSPRRRLVPSVRNSCVNYSEGKILPRQAAARTRPSGLPRASRIAARRRLPQRRLRAAVDRSTRTPRCSSSTKSANRPTNRWPSTVRERMRRLTRARRCPMVNLIDLFLHLDKHLVELATAYGPWLYGLLFLIVFAETGLVVTPFLPGDSLLFATGALAATGVLDIRLVTVLLLVAAILGDAVNYADRPLRRARASSRRRTTSGWWHRLLNRDHLATRARVLRAATAARRSSSAASCRSCARSCRSSPAPGR